MNASISPLTTAEEKEAMSNTINLNTPEPPPIPDSGEEIWPIVISDLRAQGGCNPAFLDRFIEQCRLRETMGREKHGVVFRANNGRNGLVDAFQESLDLIVYLRAALLDDANGMVAIGLPCRRNLVDLYDGACRLASRLFHLIETTKKAKAKS